MNAPAVWIFFPFLIGTVIFLFLDQRIVPFIAGAASMFLALTAIFVPIDTALLVGEFSFKISPSINFFGRSFVLNTADAPLLMIIYGTATLWFFGTEASTTPTRFAALGLMIISILTASVAVEPFLFAAILLVIAGMLVIPLLAPLDQPPGRGVIRFLIYQTLAMPFILFSGWMLAGVEASPGDLSTTLQAGTMLGLGFAFLAGVFPLYNWIPTVAEEAPPYVTGFLLWVLPTFTVIFALDFLDRYTWLRTSPQLSFAIQVAGVVMTASGGFFAALQKHLGRIMGYSAIAETGLIILALGLRSTDLVTIAFFLLLPRGLELTVWALGLSIVKSQSKSLVFSDIKGLSKQFPLTATSIILAQLSMAGFPLLAGFHPRIALWQELGREAPILAFWSFLGMIGILISASRSLAVFLTFRADSIWELKESWVQITMLAVGASALFLLGFFPQLFQPLLTNLPTLFLHLGR